MISLADRMMSVPNKTPRRNSYCGLLQIKPKIQDSTMASRVWNLEAAAGALSNYFVVDKQSKGHSITPPLNAAAMVSHQGAGSFGSNWLQMEEQNQRLDSL